MTRVGNDFNAPQQPEKDKSVQKKHTTAHDYEVKKDDTEAKVAEKTLHSQDATKTSASTTPHRITNNPKELPLETESKIIRTESGLIITNIGVEVVEKSVNLIKAMNKGNNEEINRIMKNETKETVLALVGMCLKSPKASDMTFLYDLQYHLNKNFPGVDSVLLNKAIKESVSLEGKRFEVMSEYESGKAKILEESAEKAPVKSTERRTPQFIQDIERRREQAKLATEPKVDIPKALTPEERKEIREKGLQVIDTLSKLDDGTTKTLAHTIDKTTSETGMIEITVKKQGKLDKDASKAVSENDLLKLTKMADGIVSTEKSAITKTMDKEGSIKISISPKKEKEPAKPEEPVLSDEELMASITPDELEKIINDLKNESNKPNPPQQ